MDRAVLVVRNPYEAILSEYNRGGVNPESGRDEARHVAFRKPQDFKKGLIGLCVCACACVCVCWGGGDGGGGGGGVCVCAEFFPLNITYRKIG